MACSIIVFTLILAASVGAQKPVKCFSADFKGIASCCIPAYPQALFNKTVIKNCKKLVKGEKEDFVKQYQLNKLMSNDPGDNITLPELDDVESFNKTWGPSACYVECLFEKAGLLSSNDWQEIGTAFYEYITSNFNNDATIKVKPEAPWTTINELVALCPLITLLFPNSEVTTIMQNKTPKTCSLVPLLTVQCLRTYEILFCPKEYIDPKKVEQCAENKQIAYDCNAIAILLDRSGITVPDGIEIPFRKLKSMLLEN